MLGTAELAEVGENRTAALEHAEAEGFGAKNVSEAIDDQPGKSV
jgi:hypothetical protein